MNTLRVAILLFCLPLLCQGQGNWDIGVFAGGTNYQGDLVISEGPLLSATKPAYGAFLRHSFDFRWSVRFNLLYGQLSGNDQNFDDKSRNIRNFSFNTNLLESSLILEWEPLGKKRIYGDWLFNKIFSPYLFVGLGGVILDRETNYSIATNDGIIDLISQDQNIKNPFVSPAIPFGIGLKYDINKQLLVALELGTRATFSDHLDGISKSAASEGNDWYAYGGVSVSYRFNPKDSDKDGIADRADSCPKIPGVQSSRGCPDSDGDGVEDLEDICPDQIGLPELNGCPDRDRDGIADFEDDCPATFGSMFTNGCPDADGDKIRDTDDRCPFLAGSICRLGCPILDANADGLLNEIDRCSSTPPDYMQPLVSVATKIENFFFLEKMFPNTEMEPL